MPNPSTRRWTANKKAIIVRSVKAGLISREAALERYSMEDKELASWETELATYGTPGLCITKTQTRRGSAKNR